MGSVLPDGASDEIPLTNTQSATIVVPTRNEAENITALVARLRAAFLPKSVQILFVDDSDDVTPDAIRAVARTIGQDGEVRLHHRLAECRAGGLGGAVAEGLAASATDWVVVMDGDLQHPPEVVPSLLEAGRSSGADTVVATRYRDGSAEGLNGPVRRLVSGWSRGLARLLFPRRLIGVTDPMSGFFAVRRSAVEVADLRPDGYKILLEIIVRSRIEKIVEVPYTFGSRLAGESKASLRQGLRFARHLAVLRAQTALQASSEMGRLLGFAYAGASGVLVNMAALWLLSGVLGLTTLVAAALATQVAICWNFLVIDRLVMRPGDRSGRSVARLGRFMLLMNALVPAHLLVLWTLVERLGIHYLIANGVAIAVVFVIRYLVAASWIYQARPESVARIANTLAASPIARRPTAVLMASLALARSGSLRMMRRARPGSPN